MEREIESIAVKPAPASRAGAEVEAAERASMTSPDRVVDSILRAIRAGVYVPGQRLIEADLTRPACGLATVSICRGLPSS